MPRAVPREETSPPIPSFTVRPAAFQLCSVTSDLSRTRCDDVRLKERDRETEKKIHTKLVGDGDVAGV